MDLPIRKKIRLKGYDYSQSGAYFVTICAKNRAHLFGLIIVGATALGRPSVSLTELGKCIDETIRNVNITAENDAKIDTYAIMPNHIHLMLPFARNRATEGGRPYKLWCGTSNRMFQNGQGFRRGKNHTTTISSATNRNIIKYGDT